MKIRWRAPARASDLLRIGHLVYLERLSPPLVPDPKKPDDKIEWQLAQIPDVGGAIVVLDPSDGAILALSGGYDFYHSASTAPCRPAASRVPASSHSSTAPPWTRASPRPPPSAARQSSSTTLPSRSNGDPRTTTKIRRADAPAQALALSLNLVSIRLLRFVITPTYAVEYLERFGFERERNKLGRNLTLVLGTASVSPLEMARAYAVFANGGYRIEPYFILRVEDGNGKVLEEANPARVCPNCPDPKAVAGPGSKDKKPVVAAPSVLSPEISFLMTTMLRDVIRAGTGYAATEQLKRRDLAGKTGTTNDYRDAWFAGYTHDLVVVSWIGFDQNTPLGRAETGNRAALPMWIEFMRQALDG